jgi:hypothetical protein
MVDLIALPGHVIVLHVLKPRDHEGFLVLLTWLQRLYHALLGPLIVIPVAGYKQVETSLKFLKLGLEVPILGVLPHVEQVFHVDVLSDILEQESMVQSDAVAALAAPVTQLLLCLVPLVLDVLRSQTDANVDKLEYLNHLLRKFVF